MGGASLPKGLGSPVAAHEAVKLYRQGFSDLIPLNGKAPWDHAQGHGLEGWSQYKATKEEVERWGGAGYNIGLLSKRFPGIDCDVPDVNLSIRIRTIAREEFGVTAPIRYGNKPKWLLVTRLPADSEPFKKQTLVFSKGDIEYKIEVLADGQQYVVYGIHPDTKQPYEWDTTGKLKDLWMLSSDEVPEIYLDQVITFFSRVKEMLEKDGWSVSFKAKTANEAKHEPMYAPSIELLRSAMAAVPNESNVDRDTWVNMAYAIQGAMRPEWDHEIGYELFEEWAAKWPGGNDSDANRTCWETLTESRDLDWSIIRYLAEEKGEWKAVSAKEEFAPVTTDEPPPELDSSVTLDFTKDEWQVANWIKENSDDFFATGKKDWFCWDGKRWRPDEMDEGFTKSLIGDRLYDLTDELIARYKKGISKQAKTQILKLRSTSFATTMFNRMGMRRDVHRNRDSVNNHDRVGFLLCTPGGIIDLRSGELIRHDPDLFITQITKVEPSFGNCPVWQNFLLTSCGGDASLVTYIQLVLGSALTTDVSNRLIWFLTGVSGSGKSTLLKHTHAVLGDYAGVIPQGALIHGDTQAHHSAVAGFRDKRFLHGSEIDRGHKWNVSLMKSITGNEPVTARRLYRHYEEFNVVGKIIIAGNETPTLPNVDSAVRARLRIIPFVSPAISDPQLDTRLQAEYPAILGWLIEGAQRWVANGYPKTDAIDETTETYFTEEDLIAQFCDSYFTITGNPQAFVATSIVEQLWNRFTTPDQRKEYNLRTQHSLKKAIVGSNPKLENDQRKVEGRNTRGIRGMKLRESAEKELTVEDLL